MNNKRLPSHSYHSEKLITRVLGALCQELRTETEYITFNIIVSQVLPVFSLQSRPNCVNAREGVNTYNSYQKSIQFNVYRKLIVGGIFYPESSSKRYLVSEKNHFFLDSAYLRCCSNTNTADAVSPMSSYHGPKKKSC